MKDLRCIVTHSNSQSLNNTYLRTYCMYPLLWTAEHTDVSVLMVCKHDCQEYTYSRRQRLSISAVCEISNTFKAPVDINTINTSTHTHTLHYTIHYTTHVHMCIHTYTRTQFNAACMYIQHIHCISILLYIQYRPSCIVYSICTPSLPTPCCIHTLRLPWQAVGTCVRVCACVYT